MQWNDCEVLKQAIAKRELLSQSLILHRGHCHITGRIAFVVMALRFPLQRTLRLRARGWHSCIVLLWFFYITSAAADEPFIMSRTKDKKGIARRDGVRAMGVGRIFSGGGGFFQGVGGNSLFFPSGDRKGFFQVEATVVKCHFTSSETKRNHFSEKS